MKLLRCYIKFKAFLNKYKEDHVSAFASQAAFFTILSFVPFILFFFTMIQYLPISKDIITDAILSVVPKETDALVKSLITSLYAKVNGTLLSVSIITALWSASRIILSISRGLNVVFEIKETRNYVLIRIVSMFYTVIFSFIMLFILIVLIFGNSLYRYLLKMFPIIGTVLDPILNFRFLWAGIILILFFCLTYTFIPNKRLYFMEQLPGAIFSTIGWMGLSLAFSIYVDHFSNFSYMYGSLASIMILMLWLYACMTIFFIGAEINYFLQINKPSMNFNLSKLTP